MKSLVAEHNLPVQSPPIAPEGVVPVMLDKCVFQPVSCGQIRKMVESFSSNKAPGRDKVSLAVFKDARPFILPTLTQILNRSLMSSIFKSLEGVRGQSTFEGRRS